MSPQPLVSVLVPTYNGEAFVAETLESVLAQTYAAFEVIVVDDASTDRTADIVETFIRRDPERFRLERKTDRLGPCRRRNDALDLARGPLLAWLDHDDLWLPEKLERQVAVLCDDPGVGVVYTAFEAFDETGSVRDWQDAGIEAEGDVLEPLFVDGNFVPSISAVFRRDAMTRRGVRFRETDFSFGDDYYLWLVLSLDWRFARIDTVLTRYRRHAANESTRLATTNYHLRRIALLREFLDSFPEARRRLGRARRRGLATHYVRAAGFELERGRYPRAAYLTGRAFALDPRLALGSLGPSH